MTTASAPRRHRRARHDLHAFSGANGSHRNCLPPSLRRRAANVDVRRRQIGGAHRESVARRAVKGRIVAIGDDGIGKHAPAGARKFHISRAGLMALAFCDLDDFLPRRRVREQHRSPSEPGRHEGAGHDHGRISLRPGGNHTHFDAQLKSEMNFR